MKESYKMNQQLVTILDLDAPSTEGKQFDISDLEFPRLQLIRPNSRQLKKTEADYSKEAKQGMFYNSLTKEIYDPDAKEILFIPVVFKQLIALLAPPLIPGQMGDYVATVSAGDVQFSFDAEQKKQVVTSGINVKGPDGEDISSAGLFADVRDQFSGILLYDGTAQPIILTLKGKSKQIASKKLKSMIAMHDEAIYAHMYSLTSVPTQSMNGDILIEDFKYSAPTSSLGEPMLSKVLGILEMVRRAK